MQILKTNRSTQTFDRYFTTALFFLMVLAALIVLIWQNFIFSSQFDLLPLREIDDFAFQTSLRSMHKALLSGHALKFISNNDYGYGAFFWFLNALITLPGYLLGWDQEVIVMPRFLSLAADTGALFFIWKTAGLYTRDIAIRMAFPLLMVLQPEFAFAALRFHTHALAFFFCVLAFYLSLAVDEEERLWLPIGATAFAIGIKMNAIILAPIIAGIIWLRWREITDERQLPAFVRLAVIGLAFSIFAYNPLLLLFPIFYPESLSAIRTLGTYAVMSATNPGTTTDEAWKNMLVNGYFKSYYGWWTLPLLAGTACAGFLPSLQKNTANLKMYECLWVAAGGSALAILVFLFRVKQGPAAYANYLIAIAFIPLFALLLLRLIPAKLQTTSLVVLIAGLYWTNWSAIDQYYFFYQHKLQSPDTQEALDERRKLTEMLQPVNGRIRVLTDYRVALPVTNFSPNVRREEFFDNLFLFKAGYDYIVLHHDNSAFLSEDEIKSTIKNPSNYLESHKVLENLLLYSKFQNQVFSKIFEDKSIIVYKNIAK